MNVIVIKDHMSGGKCNLKEFSNISYVNPFNPFQVSNDFLIIILLGK